MGQVGLADVELSCVDADVVGGVSDVEDGDEAAGEGKVTLPEEREDCHMVGVRYDGGREPHVEVGPGAQLEVGRGERATGAGDEEVGGQD